MARPDPDDDLPAMLRAGAEHTGTPAVKGAVHLLTFTDLVRLPTFRPLVNVETVDQPDGTTGRAGFVDWRNLLDHPAAARLGGGPTRLLTLAYGLATGQPVDVRDAVTGLGSAHARRAIEAVAIATGWPLTDER